MNIESAETRLRLRAEASKEILRTSRKESICLGAHDPILEPMEYNDFAMSFVASMLYLADAHACLQIARGIAEGSHFPDVAAAKEDPSISDDSRPRVGEQSLQEMLHERIALSRQAEEEERLLQSVATWKDVLEFLQPEVVINRIKRLSIQIQLTREDGAYRAAIRVADVVFDMPGKFKEEEVVKALILLELHLRTPIISM
jgi:hypothetical protein